MSRWDSLSHPKYHVAIHKADGTPLPDDEPLFVLRARDPLAAVLVRQYASLKRTFTNEADSEALLALATEMEEYEGKRLPDPAFAVPRSDFTAVELEGLSEWAGNMANEADDLAIRDRYYSVIQLCFSALGRIWRKSS